MNSNVHHIISNFSPDKLVDHFRRTARNFRPQRDSLDGYLQVGTPFDNAYQIGVLELPETQTVLVGTIHVKEKLSARSSKYAQYELAKRLLKAGNHNAGIFAFYDDDRRFRLSLVTATYHGTRRQFSAFRRYTFFVDPALPNKTFVQQMGRANFDTLTGILETFSIEAISDAFYKEFKPAFDAIAHAVKGTHDANLQQDFALLFAIRIIFLGFLQKKGWLGNNPKFLQDFWDEYRKTKTTDTFYKDWLQPLFFEALCSPPGRQVAYGIAPFSKQTQEALQMAPYLNGELFKRKQGVDDLELWIPDKLIGDFFSFLFQYNFTVEENELFDEELELNPEFLGIIFERITNMDQGAVYTPRVEVDLMCRLALVKWLEQTLNLKSEDLYHLFFREAGTGEAYDEYQRQGDFSPAEIRSLIEKLESVTVCDPAAGSGAFEVGMLQVLDQVLDNLYSRNNTPQDLKAKAPTPFERKKAIIANSLYGADVKRWAVWINHLRLWLTLFVDMPDSFQNSLDPLLPNLTFKVRVGDSLVQRIGGKTFPVYGHANLPPEIKRKITQLKQKKRDFFYNKSSDGLAIEQEELAVFRAILDAEIEARRAEIRKLIAPKPTQTALLDMGPTQPELDLAQTTKTQREALERQIADLEAQKRTLKDQRPFVWSIEFAEIFGERGGFDIVIGNPPYVRQEAITDPCGVLPPKDYKDALLEMVRLDFPDYFAHAPAYTDRFKQGRKPDGRSDLYTYFYIRSLRLVNPQGVHVFICSNSWLDVGYGAWLQEFFLRQAPLYWVIDNHARRSFARADVNTIITVAGAPGGIDQHHTVRFVAFKQPFEEVVLSDNLLEIAQATVIRQDGRFRVFPITAGELLQEGAEIGESTARRNTDEVHIHLQTYSGDKWGGKYLRAPDIFFTILEKGRGKLARLGEIAKVWRGITTGANDFFYLEPLGAGSRPGLLRVRNGAGWEGEIEEEFLKPVIKSPRECRSIFINPQDLRYRIFMCSKSKAELQKTKALEYIKWGEVQKYHKRPTCETRNPWWNLGQQSHSTALWFKAFNETFLVPLTPIDIYSSDRFYTIYNRIEGNWVASLNNVLIFLMIELNGRVNLGQGALDNMTYEAARNLIVKPSLLPDLLVKTDLPIQTIFTECGIDPKSDVPIAKQEPRPLPDRKALDDIVFDALGLSEDERKEVYRAVCQLVWERTSKARSM
ncbi:MAG: hypothetical protein HPY45_17955 [Anaerolineae bacterium]|nr:hypothetical protein [Anaerolineae bacterium]